MLNKVRLLYGRQVSETVAIFGGPTCNYYVSKIQDGSDIAPWSTSDYKIKDRWERWWFGIIVGVRLKTIGKDRGPFDLDLDLFNKGI
jgi:hypothetical protein